MTVSFDTLSFAKRLTEAGEKPAVAEAHAMALKEFVMDTIATKADIRDLSRSFGEEIEHVRDEIGDLRQEVHGVRQEFVSFRKEVGQEFASLRQEFEQRFATFEQRFATKDELRHEIGLLRKDVDALGLKLTVRMGGMLVVAVGAVATLGKIL
jgi:predicted  nucleic acid-binding Zn-ribbon protein